MFKQIITPFRNQFPSTPTVDTVAPVEENGPEDFARDVLLEITREAVERLKENVTSQTLDETLRVMQNSANPRLTREVFREMDGAAALLGSLSICGVNNVDTVQKTLELLRCALDSDDGHRWFQNNVGYDSLQVSIEHLLQSRSLRDLFFVFSLDPTPILPLRLEDLRQTTIIHPDVLPIVLRSSNDNATYYDALDILCTDSLRNRAVLSWLPAHLDSFQSHKKLVKHTLATGCTTPVYKSLLHSLSQANNEYERGQILELLRAGMKNGGRTTNHWSFIRSSQLYIDAEDAYTGTLMMWLMIDTLPTSDYTLLSNATFKMTVDESGSVLLSFASQHSAEARRATIGKLPVRRWTHVTLTLADTRIRRGKGRPDGTKIDFYLDGIHGFSSVLAPNLTASREEPMWMFGDTKSDMTWNLASATFLRRVLLDDLVRFVHLLGVRYHGNFQDKKLSRFLTYEGSTGVNLSLASFAPVPAVLPHYQSHARGLSTSQPISSSYAKYEDIQVVKVIRGQGIGFDKDDMIFSISPLHTEDVEELGRVLPILVNRMDDAVSRSPRGMRDILGLIESTRTPHELSRALSILYDSVRFSWSNAEDLESMNGYDILAHILCEKAELDLLNRTSFEIVMELTGIRFDTTQSTITNVQAYESIILDLQLWSKVSTELQASFFDSFYALYSSPSSSKSAFGSKFSRFNAKHRSAKLGVVRRILSALRAGWFKQEGIEMLSDALVMVVEARGFDREDEVKPLFSYLAAALGDEDTDSPAQASGVFRSLCKHLSASQSSTRNLSAAIPLARIVLLLLCSSGRTTAIGQVTQFLAVCLHSLQQESFARKFALVGGWDVLHRTLSTLDLSQEAKGNTVLAQELFTILMDTEGEGQESRVLHVHVLPAILGLLQSSLESLNVNADSLVIYILSGLNQLHSSSASFRQVWPKSKSAINQFHRVYRNYVKSLYLLEDPLTLHTQGREVLQQITHFAGCLLALQETPAWPPGLKREIQTTIQFAETLLSSTRVLDLRSAPIAAINDAQDWRNADKVIARMKDWSNNVRASESRRKRKFLLDWNDKRKKIAHQRIDILKSDIENSPKWRLDETEGPQRIRKKLQYEDVHSFNARYHERDETSSLDSQPSRHESVTDGKPVVPPWETNYDVSSISEQSMAGLGREDEDKHRRVRAELERGDVIEHVQTVARVVGVNVLPALIVIGRTHVYIIDGLVYKRTSSNTDEIVGVEDLEENEKKAMFFLPVSWNNERNRADRWKKEEVTALSERNVLFRDVALELYFKNSQSLLLIFVNKNQRKDTRRHLDQRHSRTGSDVIDPSAVFGKMSSRLGFFLASDAKSRETELNIATRKWQAREISNFTYLSVINQVSGRTPGDATQYPVFPWVIQDYTSDELDLTNPAIYRDLSKPMGALTPARRAIAETRYESLQSFVADTTDVSQLPFHYGTHFSSSMVVAHFLLRIEPFTGIFRTLQGGQGFDLPERLFTNVAKTWAGAATETRGGDVRELVPEFFHCPEFLENVNDLNMGVKSETGEQVGDVVLPPWAKGDPLLFVTMNRRALESQHVSAHLPAWIDLIWGCKQRSVEDLNVFHPLSYEENAVDLDSIKDEMEREAKVGIVHNFGQTPRKIFRNPHPPRFDHGVPTLAIGLMHGIEEDAHLLLQDSKPFSDLGSKVPVKELAFDVSGEKVIPCPAHTLVVPSSPHLYVSWSEDRGDFKLLLESKVMQIIEQAFVACASFADSSTLVTGSSDHHIRLWKLKKPPTLECLSLLRYHEHSVTTISSSRTWSAIVSGSASGEIVIWDLNRACYVQSILSHSSEIKCIAINESTGYIATASAEKLCLHTLNARPIAILPLGSMDIQFSKALGSVNTLAFHEREYSYHGVLATGDDKGQIALWTWVHRQYAVTEEKVRWELIPLRWPYFRARSGKSITALKFLGESLCHGEEGGQSFMWSLSD